MVENSLPPIDNEADLRMRALSELAHRQLIGDAKKNPDGIIHELQVHQIELEMQNETLRHTQSALERSLNHFQDLYELAPVAYITLTQQGVINEVNLTGIEFLGEPSAVLLGKPFDHFLDSADVPSWKRKFAAIMPNGGRDSLDVILRTSDLQVHAVRLDCMYTPRDGEAISVYVAITDLTARKRAEDACKKINQRFLVALKNSTTCVFEQDEHLRYTWLFNLSEAMQDARFLGKHDEDIYDLPSAKLLDQIKRKVLQTGEAFDHQIKLAHPNTLPKWYQAHFEARIDLQGEVIGLIGAMVDVTSQALHAEALDKARNEAESARKAADSANRIKSQFLAAASHDLRQPLHALDIYVDLLGHKLPSDCSEIVDNMKQCSRNLVALLNRLLNLSMIEMGAVVPQFCNFNLAELFNRLAATHAPSAHAKNLAFRIHPARINAYTDSQLLEQLLANLVSNAIKNTSNGGVLIGIRRHNGRYWVEVRDTGSGIEADYLASIFEPYRQPSIKEDGMNQGSGLGLVLVKRIADLLHLALRAKSTPGKGSLFAVELPPFMDAPLFSVQHAHQNASKTKLRIALIENQPFVRDAMLRGLRQMGHDASAATNAETLIQKLQGKIPDFIIADYRLDGQRSGIEAIALLRKHFGKPIKALIITGDTCPTVCAKLVDNNIHVLFKPVQLERIQALLDSAMSDELVI